MFTLLIPNSVTACWWIQEKNSGIWQKRIEILPNSIILNNFWFYKQCRGEADNDEEELKIGYQDDTGNQEAKRKTVGILKQSQEKSKIL